MTEAQNQGLLWHRSRACADTACVEAASEEENVFLRDAKKPDNAVLCFTRAEWDAFLTGAKAGDFDSV